MEYNVTISELRRKLDEAGFELLVLTEHRQWPALCVLVSKCTAGVYSGELVVATFDIPTGELWTADVCHTVPGERPRFSVDNYIVVYHPSYDNDIDSGLRVYKQFDPYLDENCGSWSHAGLGLMPMIFTSMWEAKEFVNNENIYKWQP